MTNDHRATLLIVDDSTTNLAVLDTLLRPWYQIRAANSGERALRAAQSSPPPDLILLDVMMPDMDGHEVLARLLENPQTRDIPVIFVTVLDDDLDEERGLTLGAVDYITKPIKPAIALARVATQLELKQARDRLAGQNAWLEAEVARRMIEITTVNRDLQRANTDLQRFAEVTAHHLQEPARRMAIYAGYLTTLLQGRIDDSEIQLSLDFIGQQAHRLKNLLRDVERYLAADQPRDEVKKTDPGRVIARLLERLSEDITQVGATVTLGHLPSAEIDAPRLSDLFEVVLENALQHGASGSPLRIAIDGERQGSLVRYQISDNGPGIDAEYREQVFRVFERLTTQGTGTGIGLAILRRIVESRGGRAWIEEAPGGGCRVLFELSAEKTSNV